MPFPRVGLMVPIEHKLAAELWPACFWRLLTASVLLPPSQRVQKACATSLRSWKKFSCCTPSLPSTMLTFNIKHWFIGTRLWRPSWPFRIKATHRSAKSFSDHRRRSRSVGRSATLGEVKSNPLVGMEGTKLYMVMMMKLPSFLDVPLEVRING